MIRKYLWNILISLDQLYNTLLGGAPDETISSRASKYPTVPGWRILARILERIDRGHLGRSHEADEGQNAIVPPTKEHLAASAFWLVSLFFLLPVFVQLLGAIFNLVGGSGL